MPKIQSSPEVWAPVSGFENLLISNYGNVLFNGDPPKMYINRGYYSFIVHATKKKVRFLKPHRLVALTFIPNPENKPTVNHKDCNKQNNHVSNLEWNTSLENMRHARKNIVFKYKRGENTKVAKLKPAEVSEIFTSVESCTALARKYNVAISTISRIKKGKRWQHLNLF